MMSDSIKDLQSIREKRSGNCRRAPARSLAVVSILGGIVGAILILGFGEIGVRVFGIHDRIFAPTNSSSERRSEASALKTASVPPTHVPVHLPEPGFDPIYTSWIPGRTVYPQGFYQYDPSIGNVLAPNEKKEVVQYAEDGSVIYRKNYTIDAHRRRVTLGQEQGSRSRALLMMGGSYVLGEGLEDGETLPSQIALLAKSYRVYNYSGSGWGPGNLLALTQSPDFGSDIPREPGGKAIYLFIDDHMNRVIGSMEIYRAPGWPNILPHYALESDGKLKREGMMSDREWLDPLYGFLSHSQLVHVLGITFPPTLTRYHFRLFTAVLANLREELKKKLGIKEFYVAFYPGSTLAGKLIPMLDHAGISSLDYSHVELGGYVNGPVQLPDGHPSAAADRFLARQMVSDLGLTGN